MNVTKKSQPKKASKEKVSQDATAKDQTPEPESVAENVVPGDESDKAVVTDDVPVTETESSEYSGNDLIIRGLLMAIIMRLPKNMRRIEERQMLDDMHSYSSQFTNEGLEVVIEMLRSIVEIFPQEIPSGLYKQRIDYAMAAVAGNNYDGGPLGIPSRDDQIAAAKRLQENVVDKNATAKEAAEKAVW